MVDPVISLGPGVIRDVILETMFTSDRQINVLLTPVTDTPNDVITVAPVRYIVRFVPGAPILMVEAAVIVVPILSSISKSPDPRILKPFIVLIFVPDTKISCLSSKAGFKSIISFLNIVIPLFEIMVRELENSNFNK